MNFFLETPCASENVSNHALCTSRSQRLCLTEVSLSIYITICPETVQRRHLSRERSTLFQELLFSMTRTRGDEIGSITIG